LYLAEWRRLLSGNLSLQERHKEAAHMADMALQDARAVS